MWKGYLRVIYVFLFALAVGDDKATQSQTIHSPSQGLSATASDKVLSTTEANSHLFEGIVGEFLESPCG